MQFGELPLADAAVPVMGAGGEEALVVGDANQRPAVAGEGDDEWLSL